MLYVCANDCKTGCGLVQGEYPDFTIPYKDVVFAPGVMSNMKPKIDKNIDGE